VSERSEVTFRVEGQRCSAWLYQPEGRTDPVPCVVMAHGTTGTKDFVLPPYASHFADAGLAVLTFDYRHFGASDGEPRQLICVPDQLQDLRGAIAFARTLPEIDPHHVALWGTSLGAGHALSVAATDPSIDAVVAQLPFLGIDPRHDSPRSASVTFALFARAVRDAIGGWFGRPPVMMPMLGHPGDVAVFSGADDYESMRVLEAAAPGWNNELAARSLFSLLRYRPLDAVRRVKAPILFLLASEDTAASAGLTERAARLAPHGRLLRYPGSHFSAYRGAVLDRMIDDETVFLLDALADHPAVAD
jgi:dienelactone hydrolase